MTREIDVARRRHVREDFGDFNSITQDALRNDTPSLIIAEFLSGRRVAGRSRFWTSLPPMAP